MTAADQKVAMFQRMGIVVFTDSSIDSKPGYRNSVQLLFINFKLIDILHMYFKHFVFSEFFHRFCKPDVRIV